MRRFLLKIALWCALVVGIGAGLAGCSQSAPPPPASPPPTPTGKTAAGGANQGGGGAVASPRATPAPTGVQTGNYAGSLKGK